MLPRLLSTMYRKDTKISILITAWKEDKTIGKAIKCIGDKNYSGIPDNFEILLAAPDEATRIEAKKVATEIGVENRFKTIIDPGKGKPLGLNLLTQEASGDILIFTDGDVFFEKNAISHMLNEFENEDKDIPILVTGRPVSDDPLNSMMAYFGHLLADAAHHKRTIELDHVESGRGAQFVSKIGFFPVSGYIYAANKAAISVMGEEIFPEDCLVDDAYISYTVHNAGGKIKYAEEAVAKIKYPTNLDDYFKQKKRSTGGYVQLWEYGVVKEETKTRSLSKELEYFWFPFKYAKSIRQFLWSCMLYPIRLWLWVMIFWERRVVKKDFVKTWVRVESTK